MKIKSSGNGYERLDEKPRQESSSKVRILLGNFKA